MNIGIIGGSDGPTSIYVASGAGSFILVAGAILCITVVLIIRSAKKRKKGRL
jgi:Na+-transporting methylmalonyl-CoA/oxaloacetate decarboxylase beta subunit